MEWFLYIIAIAIVVVTCLFFGFKRTLKIFFLSDEGESLGRKMTQTSLAATLYIAYHYAIAMVVAAAIVTTLRSWGCSFLTIFVIMWAINGLHGLVVLKINDLANVDLTLYGGARRVVDELTIRKKILGCLGEFFLIVKLAFWDGPGESIIFLRSKIRSKKEELAIFFVIAGLQMILWIPIYLYGLSGLAVCFNGFIGL